MDTVEGTGAGSTDDVAVGSIVIKILSLLLLSLILLLALLLLSLLLLSVCAVVELSANASDEDEVAGETVLPDDDVNEDITDEPNCVILLNVEVLLRRLFLAEPITQFITTASSPSSSTRTNRISRQ